MKTIILSAILISSLFANAAVRECPLPDSLEEYDMVINDGSQFLAGEKASGCLQKLMTAARKDGLKDLTDVDLVRMLMSAAYKAEVELK